MSKLNIHPEHDFVFVEQIKAKQTTLASGIILAEVNKFKDTLNGKVVAVSKTSEHPMTIELGDSVYFTEVNVKTKTILDGKEYLVISEKDILGYSRHEHKSV
jgi:co-chaperonin GroES (HSP10)